MNFNNIGGDLGILGIPVAVVITLLVQLAKMLGMPSNWAPYSSLAIGVLASLGVQLTRPYVFDVSFVVYTLIIAVSYALMAMGVFSAMIGTQDHIRSKAIQADNNTNLLVEPVQVQLHPGSVILDPRPPPAFSRDIPDEPVVPTPPSDSTMHVIGGERVDGPFRTNTSTGPK